MQKNLSEHEIRELLEHECYGHLGCSDNGRPYVVPVTFVYKDGSLFCFSFVGEKVDIMRGNSRICLQVERLKSPVEWRSAIVHGDYEELVGREREEGLALLLERLWAETNKDHPLFMPFRHSAQALERSKEGDDVLIWRLRIKERSGRMQRYE